MFRSVLVYENPKPFDSAVRKSRNEQKYRNEHGMYVCMYVVAAAAAAAVIIVIVLLLGGSSRCWCGVRGTDTRSVVLFER